MRIHIEDIPKDIKMIRLEGYIDENTITLVEDAFLSVFNLGYCKIICDMTGVEHISAPVFKRFIGHIEKARSLGGEVKLCNIHSSLQGVFRYAGFNDESVFVTDINSGVQALRRAFGAYMSDPTVKGEPSPLNDSFGPTTQTPDSNIYSPTIQSKQSPLESRPSPKKNEAADDQFGATIQMSGSPLKKQQPVDDQFGSTIQMSGSPLRKQQPSDDLYGTTMQMSDSPLKQSTTQESQSPKIIESKPSNASPKPLENKKKASISPPQLKKAAEEKKGGKHTPQPVSAPAPPPPAQSPVSAPIPPPPAQSPVSASVPPQIQPTTNTPQGYVQQTETEIKRKSNTRFYKQMYPFCIFPLKVIFSQEKIQKIVHKKITQVEGKKDIVVTKEKPIIKVVPHMPGCLVIPPHKKIDVTPDISQANFSVTPLAESRNQRGYVEIYYNGEVIDTIENLTYTVQKQTIAKLAFYMSIISPVVSTSLDTMQIDFNDNLPLIVQWLSNITQFFGGKTGFGLALAGMFLGISIVFYLIKRPKEANPIENILPVAE